MRTRGVGKAAILDRRALLLGLLSCPACASLARAADAAHGPHWTFAEGPEGPARWGELDPSFKVCAVGTEQSPIDLKGAIRANLPPVRLDWRPEAYAVVNNGHYIQANAKPGSVARIGGETYELKQFHFHTPSEHAIDGVRTAMEAHFVHAGAKGGFAVIGVFMKAGAPNATFHTLMAAAPRRPGGEQTLPRPLDPRQLVPARGPLYRYAGSLTTPPCAEVVAWNIYARPIEVAAADIAAFRAIFPMNARPLQPRNRRFVLLGS